MTISSSRATDRRGRGCSDAAWARSIGSGMGIQNHANLRILRERITEVPMIVDAGSWHRVGCGCGNGIGRGRRSDDTAIAEAQDAVLMPRRCATALPPDAKRF